MKQAKLIVTLENGLEGYGSKVFDLDLTKPSVEFEVGYSFEYIHDTSCCDGDVFDVFVEFSNDSGSRTEKYSLVPMKIN